MATDAMIPGGVGRHIKDLARGFIERRCEVSLTAPAGSAMRQTADELGVPFTAFARAPGGADIWHLHLADTYHRGSVHQLARARLRNHRIVLTEHLPRSNASDAALTEDRRTPGAHAAKTAFKRIQFAVTHAVVAVSSGSRSFLIDRYGLAPDKVVAISNGVDLSRFASSAGLPVTEPPVVLAVGALVRQKGHDLLIRAAAASRGDWRVVIAGEGPHRQELQRLADAVAPGRVELVGWLDDIRADMLAATAVCVPSRWEACAYVVPEAMALGRPVVATRVDGISDMIVHGHSGIVVDPDDPAKLAVEIDRLVDTRALAASIATTARQAAAGFGVDRMVRDTFELYRSLR
ncbi:hypothetical protein GCM10010532_093930 [Dactylosporangium siamense]|uniref:Glycosyl transferase n=1 Tax=Dactylosporangium siamense TaxID=685454 RepID=A0A919UFK0_9ACTN|nr:glycosyl transferase [Dactylosporangium siamense]